MDINTLHYMDELKKNKTISSTARKLFLTQPALTNAIKRLEQELGVVLVNRDVYPIEFTEAGDIFLKYAREIIKQEQRMQEALSAQNSSKEGVVRIAITSAGISGLIKNQKILNEKIPNLNFDIKEYDSAICEEKLLDGVVDLLFITTPLIAPEIEYKVVDRHNMVFVASKLNPTFKDVDISNNSVEQPLTITKEELEKQTFFMTTPQTGLSRFTKEFFKSYDFKPSSVMQLGSITSCYRMAASGAGIVLVDESSVARRSLAKDLTVYCVLEKEKMYRDVVVARNKIAKPKYLVDLIYNTIPALL